MHAFRRAISDITHTHERACVRSYETCAVVLAFATGGDTERYCSSHIHARTLSRSTARAEHTDRGIYTPSEPNSNTAPPTTFHRTYSINRNCRFVLSFEHASATFFSRSSTVSNIGNTHTARFALTRTHAATCTRFHSFHVCDQSPPSRPFGTQPLYVLAWRRRACALDRELL